MIQKDQSHRKSPGLDFSRFSIFANFFPFKSYIDLKSGGEQLLLSSRSRIRLPSTRFGPFWGPKMGWIRPYANFSNFPIFSPFKGYIDIKSGEKQLLLNSRSRIRPPSTRLGPFLGPKMGWIRPYGNFSNFAIFFPFKGYIDLKSGEKQLLLYG